MPQFRLKTKQDILNLKESGKYLTELLLYIFDLAEPGVSLIELEKKAEEWLLKKNLKGAFKGYQNYPANLCLSVNDCVVHGIPDNYILQFGDLLKIDAGVLYKGMISDAAVSKIVGGIDKNEIGFKLIKTTKSALDKGVEKLRNSGNFFEYGKIVEKTMKSASFSVIRDLTGHGVGFSVHELPYIYNWGNKENKKILAMEGLVVALEPITAIKSAKFTERPGNSRNLYTLNGDLGAQWEYTIAFGDNGLEVVAGVQEDLFV